MESGLQRKGARKPVCSDEDEGSAAYDCNGVEGERDLCSPASSDTRGTELQGYGTRVRQGRRTQESVYKARQTGSTHKVGREGDGLMEVLSLERALRSNMHTPPVPPYCT